MSHNCMRTSDSIAMLGVSHRSVQVLRHIPDRLLWTDRGEIVVAVDPVTHAGTHRLGSHSFALDVSKINDEDALGTWNVWSMRPGRDYRIVDPPHEDVDYAESARVITADLVRVRAYEGTDSFYRLAAGDAKLEYLKQLQSRGLAVSEDGLLKYTGENPIRVDLR